MQNDSFLTDYFSKSEAGRSKEQSEASISSFHNADQFDDAHQFVMRDPDQNRRVGIYSTIVVAIFLGIVVIFCVRHLQTNQNHRVRPRLTEITNQLVSEEESLVVENVGVQRSAVRLDTPEEWFQKGLDYVGKEDYIEAVKWYRKAAEQGHADAQFRLGSCYAFGEGVEQSWERAVYWAERAAKQGHKEALYNLAGCYEDGRGVAQSFKEAARLYRKAADQGHANAQFSLGCYYELGRGVPKIRTEAIKWYRRAAKQDNDDAKAALERLGDYYYTYGIDF